MASACHADEVEQHYHRYKYFMDQSINGTGFFNSFMTSKDLYSINKNGTSQDPYNRPIGNARNTYVIVKMDNRAHGSGEYRMNSEMTSSNDAQISKWGMYYLDEKYIRMNESSFFLYAPAKMTFGYNSWQANIQSKGADNIFLKNIITSKEYTPTDPAIIYNPRPKDWKTKMNPYDSIQNFVYVSGISMDYKYDDLNNIRKNVSLEGYWADSSDVRNPDTDFFKAKYENESRTSIDLESSFSGRGHIGAMQIDASSKNANIMVDEDYVGEFTVNKKMTYVVHKNESYDIDYWLPLCGNGFSDMNPLDQRPFKSANGVFDCTCNHLPASIVSKY